MRNLFRRAVPGAPGGPNADKAIPDDMWVRCPRCRELIYSREWEHSFKVCSKCGHSAQLTADERVRLLLDEGSFEELDAGMHSGDPLRFAPEGRPSYREKLEKSAQESGRAEACIYGRGTLDGMPIVFAMLDMSFFAGSMGSVVGEKITRASELARAERRPLIICSASGGVRQQEGVVGLLQMAKTVAAINALGRGRIPYISIFTDPTLGGISASFAALGDCIIAEPGAVIGFAGPRVVEQTSGEKLPPGAQEAEFQLRHGMVDLVVLRRDLREAVAKVLRLYQDAAQSARAALSDASTTRRSLAEPVAAGWAAG
ncbi:MAG: acetyl-CoA carboxylase, carboxyltransferase subunit beta [Chloroflexota bacterium]